MTSFTVDWEDEATSELVVLWMLAKDQRGMTHAQARADRLLASDPIGNGRLLSEGLYQLQASPLILFYEIDIDSRRVNVTWVKASS